MKAPRFTSIDLAYGCHEGSFELPTDGQPVVISGPNGSGKTTLLEALLRTVFGFRRTVPTDRAGLNDRRPWSSTPPRASVSLVDPTGTLLRIERDFDTDDVTVTSVQDDKAVFSGSVRPKGGKKSGRGYADLVREWFGVRDLDPYLRSAWIRQGDLRETRLSEEILQIAEGGHAAVDTARATIEDAYYGITARPLVKKHRSKQNDRRLEKLVHRITEVEAQLEEVQAEEEARRPLLSRYAELQMLDAQCAQEIEVLEASLGPLSEHTAVSSSRREKERLLRQLETQREELRNARRELAETKGIWERLEADGLYPDDFEMRLGALEVLWRDERRLATAHEEAVEITSVAATPTGTILIAVLGAIAFVSGLSAAAIGGFSGTATILGGVLAFTGLVAATAAWLTRGGTDPASREIAERTLQIELRLQENRDDIGEVVRDIPKGDTLTADTLPDRRANFRRQMEAREQLEGTRRRLAEVAERTRPALWSVAETAPGMSVRPDKTKVDEASENQGDFFGSESPEAEATATLTAVEQGEKFGMPWPEPEERDQRDDREAIGAEEEIPGEDAERLESADGLDASLDAVISSLRTRMAKIDLVQQDVKTDLEVNLPDGVQQELEAVQVALAERRTERDEARDEAREIDRRLAREGSMSASSVALSDQLAGLHEEQAALEREAESHRAAYRLIADAYDEFRSQDQARLLGCISDRLGSMTSGAIGPIITSDSLETARVRIADQEVRLDSPPLSFGELHAVLLAIRLGSTDFLAGMNISPPLLIDEPFAHLDEARAAEVWNLLREIARARQVIVTSQDRLMLEHLSIAPSIELPAR